jgi:hypothetical protein
MKLVQLLLLSLAFLLLTACIATEDETEDNQANFVTLKQAQMNSDVAMNDMLETMEEESFAVTFYETENGYGVINFWQGEEGWGSYGRSFQEYNNSEPLTYLGNFSGVKQPKAVLYGQINDANISKVDVITTNIEKHTAKIITGTYGTYWYYIDKDSEVMDIKANKVIAFDKEGNVVIER